MKWDRVFTYKEGKLFWKSDRGGRVLQGSLAGHITKKGYVSIRCGSKFYLRHRIIWEMFNGPIPEGMEIDHVNHIPGDDRLENLRLVTRLENNRNASLSKDNKSGITGVCWHKRNNRWKAYINVNGKQISLGSFSNLNDAVKVRKEAEVKYGYHPNHGNTK